VIEKLIVSPEMPREEAVRRGWPVVFSPAFMEERPDVIDRLTERALERPTPLDVMMRQMAAIQGFDAYERLGQVAVPTLVITGDADVLVPPENSAILAQRIPAATLKTLAGAGHGFFWESPDEVASLVRDFVLSA
jgi:pimeloyl-ACP methyl ester carboxylesterase